jgi:glycosyltransferase involved in cell wall biosynthesis
MPDLPERPPIAQAPLSLILFAHNAGSDLEDVVAAWDGYLSTLARPYEILLVDDGSSDETGARAESLTGQTPSLRVLRHELPRGIGAALRTGLGQARYPLLVTAPCAKQYQPGDLYRALESIDQVDLVTGYRIGRPLPYWLSIWDGGRRILGRIFLGASLEPRGCWLGLNGWRRRFMARWLFGVRVQDPECSYRLCRREIFDRLPIQSDSSFALIEILAKANHLECIMAEVPVSWVPARHSSHAPGETNIAQEMRRLFFKPEFGHAPAKP